DRNKTADALIAEAERMGGYFSERSDDSVTFKIPARHTKALLAKVDPLGVVVERTTHAEDVAAQLLEARTLLKSREQVLQRYFGVLNQAGPSTVVSVEREMTALVREIEELRGDIRLLEHRVQFASVSVQFQFRDRQAPARSGDSSFAWLNTVNLVDLLAEFSYGH
ncbi:MAG: DUF4349 domain-containing protein, partial [Deltaproteobacteria bacterium]|nr:DUF4349 domain-containing protein [Deltaproteobacteria bacterium]